MSGSTIRLAGYAALFNRPDAARDIIVRGAFSRALAERVEPLPLYWQHRPDQMIGMVEHVEEDRRGLRVIARVDKLGSRAVVALRTKAVSGLSFGYRARVYRLLPQGRLLEDIDLFEVSLVIHPLQHGARVHLVQ